MSDREGGVKGLATGFEGCLDSVFQDAVERGAFRIPGLVAMARRGPCAYGPKGFGCLNAEAGLPMPANAMMRMYSMTKVLTCAVALMLYERQLFKLSDLVSQYIPSFQREWSVVREADSTKAPPEQVEVINLSSGRRSEVGLVREPSREEMRVKHLLTETSGIGYDVWGDLDEDLDHVLGTGRSFQIASALRARRYRTVYSSACILGHDLNLAEFCDALAEVGVLATEPGTFSYGLGAAVLSRVLEVAYSRWTGEDLPLSGIFARMLFEPLGMNSAAFFLQDGDPRADLVPPLYGVKEGDEGVHIVPAAASVPPGSLPYRNGTDHVSGPRKFESGDAGALMTVEDYARFLDFLARGGVTENGERLLSPGGVAMLTAGRISGLKLDTPLARLLGCAGPANEGPEGSFQFGWRVSHAGGWRDDYDGSYHPAMCSWSGYAHTTVSYFRDDDAWLIIAPQLMAHGPTGSSRIDEVLTAPATRAFLNLWR